MSDKILRYSAEAIIIYLLLRYFPHKESRLTTYQALVATFVLLVVSIVIELLISTYLVKHEDKVKPETFLEKFDEAVKRSAISGCSGCGGDKRSNDSTDANVASVSGDSNDQSRESLISRYTNNDQPMRTRYGIDGMLYGDDDDDKTNNLPMASDYEPSYSYISSDSSSLIEHPVSH